MSISYFLGANSRDGFFSLYGEFCSGKDDYLHIIKGGPGTGKSSFMRKIAKAAENKGLHVEYILCSGDPDSLDGIYIPQMKTGWVDGTAPHVIEPKRFGIDSDYVNLGDFCKTRLPGQDRSYVNSLYDRYRDKYTAAYDFLKAASLLRRRSVPPLFSGEYAETLREYVRKVLNDAGARHNCSALVKRRFFHAVCCKGDIYLNGSVNLLCKQYYVLDSEFDSSSSALKIAAEEAINRSCEVILSFHPRDTDKLEAVLIPELSLAFVSGDWEIEENTCFMLDSLLPKDLVREQRLQLRDIRRLEDKLMGLAVEKLAHAKALHDELEEFYKASMDYMALNEFTEDYIKMTI